MLANKPNLIEPTRFEVVVENREQIDRINLRGADLLYYLRMTLRNSHLTMSIRESEMHEQQRAFSQREKYDLMIKHNPDLNLLKETFGLELA